MGESGKVKISENFTMNFMKILKLSPKGQITIPKEVRNKMKSDAFAMEVLGETVVLRPITIPSADELSGFVGLAENSFDFWNSEEDDVYQNFYK